MHVCPICGVKINIDKVTMTGELGCSYYDWLISCNNCTLINLHYPADSYHERRYFKTSDEALNAFEERCIRSKAEKQIRDLNPSRCCPECGRMIPNGILRYCSNCGRLFK